MKKAILLIIFFICIFKSVTAQLNGYSLEFEDVITMSADSDVVITAPISWSRTFTIPSGQVLKITTGWLFKTLSVSNRTGAYLYSTFITVNGQKYFAPVVGPTTDVISGAFKIIHDSPIWVSGGKTVGITMLVEASSGTVSGSAPAAIPSGSWITGVLFKKVPN